MILAGDVGGTKTRLALYAPGASPRSPVREDRASSAEHATLEDIVRAFLGPDSGHVTSAAFGIAGPVVENRTETTNLPWTLDGETLGDRLGGARVRLLNDLEATGWGLPHLGAGDLLTLQGGVPSHGNRALIAAGTGLGEAFLVWDGTWHKPSPSEGGHADFASRDTLEDELGLWLRARYGHVSYERILSGRGLADVYRFMTDSGRGAEPPSFAAAFQAAADPASLVSAAALDGSCERAALALDRWVRTYGAEAGNLALKALAVNGVFVGGGIAPKVRPAFETGAFIDSFRSKGRLRPVLENTPVHLVLDDRTALWGAAAFAMAHASGAPVVARNA